MPALDFYSALYQLLDLDTEDTTDYLQAAIDNGLRLVDVVRGVRGKIVAKTAGWTPALTEQGAVYTYNSASGGTCTLPQDSDVAFPVGTEFIVYTIGAGAVTYAPGTGATVNSVGPDLVGGAQYSRTVVFKRAANTWIVNYGL